MKTADGSAFINKCKGDHLQFAIKCQLQHSMAPAFQYCWYDHVSFLQRDIRLFMAAAGNIKKPYTGKIQLYTMSEL